MPRTSAATAEALARERLAGAPRTAPLAAAPFVRVPAGLSHHGWHVRAGDLDCFVRLARAGAESLGADLRAECRVLQVVARAGIAPRVVRCDPAARLLVTQWIDARQAARRAPTAGLHTVATLLARLHRLPPAAGARRVDFAAQATMLESLPGAGGAAPRLAGTARAVFARLASDAPTDVLCHHDLHGLNMLFDPAGRLWLVDWEYAGLGDPVFDLASYASQHRLTIRAERELLAAYRRGGGQADPVRIRWARWVFDYVQWLWYRAAAAAATATGEPAEFARRAARLGSSLRGRASRLPGLR